MKASILFSGGIDSTYTAMKLTDQYDQIYLLTYSNGYGHLHIDRTKKRYKELDKLFPGKFKHEIINIKKIFEKIVIDSISKDMKKYSSGFFWCFGCKLSMHTQTIIFNRNKGIKKTIDGSSADTKEMVEQSPFSISLIKKLYKEHSQSFNSTHYNISREEKRKFLSKNNIRLGIKIFDRHIGIQPKCVPGELYYSSYILFNKLPLHKNKEISTFYNEKINHIKKIISTK